jgi:hypothetical protein
VFSAFFVGPARDGFRARHHELGNFKAIQPPLILARLALRVVETVQISIRYVNMAKKRRRSEQVSERPPEGCHHYESLGEMSWDTQKWGLVYIYI